MMLIAVVIAKECDCELINLASFDAYVFRPYSFEPRSKRLGSS